MRKLYIAILLLATLFLVTGAIVYSAIQASAPKPAIPGVSVGDTFTYTLKGTANLYDDNAVIPDTFYLNNATEYYKVTVTGIEGSKISLDTVWRLTNGTETVSSQTINIANGEKTDADGFWVIYASNMDLGDRLRPSGFDGKTVNQTDIRQYASGTRATNYFTVSDQFLDIRDPTGSTQRYEIVNVYFDKETGMMVSLTNIQGYNNPSMTLVITWTLVDSSVWVVK